MVSVWDLDWLELKLSEVDVSDHGDKPAYVLQYDRNHFIIRNGSAKSLVVLF